MADVQIPVSAIESMLSFCENSLDPDFPHEYQECSDALVKVYQAIAIAKGIAIETVVQERSMGWRDGAESFYPRQVEPNI